MSDPVYYLVMWAWNLLLYCAFVFVFCVFGGLIGLKIFTLNSYSLQVSGRRDLGCLHLLVFCRLQQLQLL